MLSHLRPRDEHLPAMVRKAFGRSKKIVLSTKRFINHRNFFFDWEIALFSFLENMQFNLRYSFTLNQFSCERVTLSASYAPCQVDFGDKTILLGLTICRAPRKV